MADTVMTVRGVSSPKVHLSCAGIALCGWSGPAIEVPAVPTCQRCLQAEKRR